MGGNIEEEEIREILSWFPGVDIKYFLETGTYKGDSSRAASKIFHGVHTIEILENLYEESKNKALEMGISNIVHYHGDTIKLLPGIVKNLQAPTFFFLDAHQSGPDTSNNGKWVPLLEELDLILNDINYPCIFCLDDVRLWSKHWDWAGVTSKSVLDVFKKHNKEVAFHFENNDRFIIATT